MCTVNYDPKDKCIKYRFFVIPGNGPTLIGIPDIDLLRILRITCDLIGESHENRKFNLQTRETSDSPSCRTNDNQYTKMCVMTK